MAPHLLFHLPSSHLQATSTRSSSSSSHFSRPSSSAPHDQQEHTPLGPSLLLLPLGRPSHAISSFPPRHRVRFSLADHSWLSLLNRRLTSRKNPRSALIALPPGGSFLEGPSRAHESSLPLVLLLHGSAEHREKRLSLRHAAASPASFLLTNRPRLPHGTGSGSLVRPANRERVHTLESSSRSEAFPLLYREAVPGSLDPRPSSGLTARSRDEKLGRGRGPRVLADGATGRRR